MFANVGLASNFLTYGWSERLRVTLPCDAFWHLNFCANQHISPKMLSSEQILEGAARDGSIDMYGYLSLTCDHVLTKATTAPNGLACWRACSRSCTTYAALA